MRVQSWSEGWLQPQQPEGKHSQLLEAHSCFTPHPLNSWLHTPAKPWPDTSSTPSFLRVEE